MQRLPAEIIVENDDGSCVIEYINSNDSMNMSITVDSSRICRDIRKYRLIGDKVNVRRAAVMNTDDSDIVCKLEGGGIAETVGDEVAVMCNGKKVLRLCLENGLGWITARYAQIFDIHILCCRLEVRVFLVSSLYISMCDYHHYCYYYDCNKDMKITR